LSITRRPLQYPRDYPDQPSREKGIDVQIAVDLIRLVTQGVYQTAIVFSRDTDLVPAIEAVREIKTIRTHFEVAGWAGDVSQIRLPASGATASPPTTTRPSATTPTTRNRPEQAQQPRSPLPRSTSRCPC
jgi:hypothetical protein